MPDWNVFTLLSNEYPKGLEKRVKLARQDLAVVISYIQFFLTFEAENLSPTHFEIFQPHTREQKKMLNNEDDAETIASFFNLLGELGSKTGLLNEMLEGLKSVGMSFEDYEVTPTWTFQCPTTPCQCPFSQYILDFKYKPRK